MKINGFDYKTGKATAETLSEWRSRMAPILKDGGKRRVEKGETFVHDRNGVMVFEVYANIAPKEVA